MKIFVISLKTAIDRREAISDRLHALGVDFRFFDAISSHAAPETHFDSVDLDTYRLNTYRAPLPSEIACFASHRAVWAMAREAREPVLILEDDAWPNDRFPDAVKVTARIIGKAGFIRLQSYRRKNSYRLGTRTWPLFDLGSFRLQYISNVPLCTLGYAISPEAAGKLVAASHCCDAPVDKFIQRTWDHGTPILALEPASVEESLHADESTIGSRVRKTKDVKTFLRRCRYKSQGEARRIKFDRHQLRSIGASSLADENPAD